jgi:hypothetical protein
VQAFQQADVEPAEQLLLAEEEVVQRWGALHELAPAGGRGGAAGSTAGQLTATFPTIVTVVVAVPALFEISKVAIPVAVAAGIVLAIPVAWLVTRALKQAPVRPSAPG